MKPVLRDCVEVPSDKSEVSEEGWSFIDRNQNKRKRNVVSRKVTMPRKVEMEVDSKTPEEAELGTEPKMKSKVSQDQPEGIQQYMTKTEEDSETPVKNQVDISVVARVELELPSVTSKKVKKLQTSEKRLKNKPVCIGTKVKKSKNSKTDAKAIAAAKVDDRHILVLVLIVIIGMVVWKMFVMLSNIQEEVVMIREKMMEDSEEDLENYFQDGCDI